VQRLNGEVLQDARTTDLIFPIPVLISYISTYITLEVGDLILTGTPEGIGFFREPKIGLADGDVVEVEIDGIGVLRNQVRAV
jgi:2-keto-4-pentenoate hydratase/2-oxohepta-3-ene-1,7-dioic acid hydratase in catechol pathway